MYLTEINCFESYITNKLYTYITFEWSISALLYPHRLMLEKLLQKNQLLFSWSWHLGSQHGCQATSTHLLLYMQYWLSTYAQFPSRERKSQILWCITHARSFCLCLSLLDCWTNIQKLQMVDKYCAKLTSNNH